MEEGWEIIDDAGFQKKQEGTGLRLYKGICLNGC